MTIKVKILEIPTNAELKAQAENIWEQYKYNGELSDTHLTEEYEIIDLAIIKSPSDGNININIFLYKNPVNDKYSFTTSLLSDLIPSEILAAVYTNDSGEDFYDYDYGNITVYKLDFDNFIITPSIPETLVDLQSSIESGIGANISQAYRSKEKLINVLSQE